MLFLGNNYNKRNYMLKNINSTNIIIFLICLLFSCNKSEIKEKKINKKNNISEINNTDCVDYIALYSTTEISQEIGKSKKWVMLNYTVDIFDSPVYNEMENKTGYLRASSYARILERFDDMFLVESPMKATGWISKEHVKSIVKKNPKTLALCNE